MQTASETAEADVVQPASHERPHARGFSRLAMAGALVLSAGWGALLCYSAMYLTGGISAIERPDDASEFQAGFGPVLKEVPSDIMRVRAARKLAEPDVEPDAQSPAPPVPQETILPPVPAPAAVAAADASSAQAAARVAPKRDDYVGTWGPTSAACGSLARRRGYLPAVIGQNGARAGDTRCTFRDVERDGPSWVMSASCSDKTSRWSSEVKLTVSGDRLTWSSGKGSSSYVRCPRREG